MKLTDVSDQELVARMKSLCADGRRIDAALIAHLVEVEDRRLHLEAACSSLFDFCVRKLGMSEGVAFRRITAARLARRFPAVLGDLESGRIHLSSLVLLRDHLTEANLEELITIASGMSTRKVEELVARLAPRPDVPSLIRKLPTPAVVASRAMPALPLITPTAITAPSVPSAPAAAPIAARPTRALTPLSEDRYKVQLTAGPVLRDKLERARDLMRHRNPSGDLAVVVERALDALIAKLEREKLGARSRPEAQASENENETRRETQGTRSPANGPANGPANVSRAVRRAVFARDGEQCTFLDVHGARCPSRTFLELDHRRARARNGATSEENLRVLCRAHNQLHAEQDFGRAHVESRIHFRRRKSPPREVPCRPMRSAPESGTSPPHRGER